MKYLMEHELAFDANCIGFPSIQGCHAIVYQNATGLYGFHVAGGSGEAKWPHNARLFAQFVLKHDKLANSPSRLYGVTFVGTNQRGYSLPAQDNWKRELVEFATKLTYSGKISGYDLDNTLDGTQDSSYVEFRRAGNKCDLHIAKWTGPLKPPRAANTANTDHMGREGTMDNPRLTNLANVVTGIGPHPLTHVHKKKLR